jgi:hypothetical protein
MLKAEGSRLEAESLRLKAESSRFKAQSIKRVYRWLKCEYIIKKGCARLAGTAFFCGHSLFK